MTATTRTLDDLLLFFPAPLADLVRQDHISDIMINGDGLAYIDIDGILVPAELDGGISYSQLMGAVENVARLTGNDFDNSRPILNARLPDGSRVAVVGGASSIGGLTLTIRKFNRWFSLEELVDSGTLTDHLAQHISDTLANKDNDLISGGTGSGKTTLLGSALRTIGQAERLIVIEDPAELQVTQPNAVRWEVTPAIGTRKGVSMSDLVVAALRHRPDRIVVGEVKDHSAWDLLQAMNTGHGGTLGTIHASSAKSALHRLAGLALSAHPNLDHGFVRAEVASAIRHVYHIERAPNGSRSIREAITVEGYDQGRGEFMTKPVEFTENEAA